MKRFAVALAATALVLTGCATSSQLEVDSQEVPLPDGGTVTCVTTIDSFNGGSGGVSCDWANRTR